MLQNDQNSIEFISAINEEKSARTLTKTGKILIGITGGVAIGLTALCVPFVSPALRKFCLPYIPATDVQVKNVFEALRGRSATGSTLIDLGSGDGRIVIEAAKRNFNAVGVELNSFLVFFSKIEALRKGCGNRAKFMRHDLWTIDLKCYDNIVIFGVEQMMLELEKKLQIDCDKNCNIIACRFPLPSHKPLRTVGHGIDTVWIYNNISPAIKN